MIVLDASAAVELVLSTPRGRRIESLLGAADTILAAPSLLDVEVLHALRRLVSGSTVSERRAALALALLEALEVDRYHHALLRARIWQLRHGLTPYDAAYCVLAELLGAPLLTCDARLARSPDLPCEVELVS